MILDIEKMDPRAEFDYGDSTPEEIAAFEAEQEAFYQEFVQERAEMEVALAEGRISAEAFGDFLDDHK